MAAEQPGPITPTGFLHLPKAAGSSIAVSLSECFGWEHRSPLAMDQRILGDFDDHASLAPDIAASLAPTDPAALASAAAEAQLFIGHISLTTFRHLVPERRILTILREPRARLLSQHLFWCLRSEEENLRWGTFQTQRLAEPGLRHYLEADEAAHTHDNLMCRLLVDETPLCPPHAPIAAGDHEQVADLAWSAVQRLGLVTFIEHDHVWDQVSEFVGAPLTPMRVNETADHPTVPSFSELRMDEPTLALVERSTGADQLLYERLLSSMTGVSERGATKVAERRFLAQLDRYRSTLAMTHQRAAAQASDDVDDAQRSDVVTRWVDASKHLARRVRNRIRR